MGSMKKEVETLIIAILVVISIIFIVVIGYLTFNGERAGTEYKYTINRNYGTNEYREVDGCILFTDHRDKEMKVCGEYIIEFN